ncbi:MAG: hypothetical protein KC731_14825, partial [Myxococcales bacterium]|nr:hypothetical protein [Myxococcales bacterium]
PTSEQVAPSTSPPTTATAPPTSVIVNPTSAEGRHVMRAYQGDGCFVYLPFPPLRDGEMRPPGSAPPTKTVPCPKAMADPAYETCRGGVIERRGDGCRCMESGNPPRIMANACPAEAPAP